MRPRWTRFSVSGECRGARPGRSRPFTPSSAPLGSDPSVPRRTRKAPSMISCTRRSWSRMTMSISAASISRTAARATRRTSFRSRALRWPTCAPPTSIASQPVTGRLPQRWRSALTRPRILWIVAAVVAILAITLLWAVPRLQPATGTLVVVAAGRAATSLTDGTLMLQRNDGSWITVGSVSGSVPPAPDQHQLIALPFPVGTYDHIRLRGDVERVNVIVAAGQVEPLLLGIESGNLIPGAVYAGNDEVNLGLGELAGKFVPMPGFDLIDHANRAFNSSTTAGKDVVIAAFHTTCHETCPLYTALFLQLAKRVPPTVTLAEVTTDPDVDSAAVLSEYRNRIGATWEFATGTREKVASFWKAFGVELASGDTHTSTLALLDRHGYIRLVYRGAPSIGNDIPPALVSSLSAQGLRQLASGGDGWGVRDLGIADDDLRPGRRHHRPAPGWPDRRARARLGVVQADHSVDWPTDGVDRLISACRVSDRLLRLPPDRARRRGASDRIGSWLPRLAALSRASLSRGRRPLDHRVLAPDRRSYHGDSPHRDGRAGMGCLPQSAPAVGVARDRLAHRDRGRRRPRPCGRRERACALVGRGPPGAGHDNPRLSPRHRGHVVARNSGSPGPFRAPSGWNRRRGDVWADAHRFHGRRKLGRRRLSRLAPLWQRLRVELHGGGRVLDASPRLCPVDRRPARVRAHRRPGGGIVAADCDPNDHRARAASRGWSRCGPDRIGTVQRPARRHRHPRVGGHAVDRAHDPSPRRSRAFDVQARGGEATRVSLAPALPRARGLTSVARDYISLLKLRVVW